MFNISFMRGSRKFSRGGGGGGVEIPRRGLTENFNMAKINNLAIPGGGGSGPPVPPLDPPMPFHVVLVRYCQFGVSPVNHSDSDSTKKPGLIC